MARMPLTTKQEVVRLLHDVHERHDLGEDEAALIQLQHDLEELLSTAAALLGDVQGGPVC
jgi:hypothetical protein